MTVEGGRAGFVVSCLTHSFPSISILGKLFLITRADVQLVELQDIGMAVGGANDLALRCGGLRGLVVLVALTVG